jgi:Spy/CpxP family protein refolding chaperone
MWRLLYLPTNLISDNSEDRGEVKDNTFMKKETKVRSGRTAVAAVLLVAAGFIQAKAQSPTPSPVQSGQGQASQTTQIPNLQAELNLTPEQIQKWRAINLELREQQQAANQRLREARRALAEAVESPTPNEELIKQRAHEVSEAQATIIQLQSLKEARILQVLTPEQRVKLKEIRQEIRQQNQALRRGGNQQLPRNGLGRRSEGLPRTGNQGPPPGPRQRKLIRQQPRR